MSAQILDPPAAAAYLQVPLRTLDKWRYLRRGPTYCRVGRHIRYRLADLDAWLETQAVSPRGVA